MDGGAEAMTPKRFAAIKKIVTEFHRTNTGIGSHYICDELIQAYEEAQQRIVELEKFNAEVISWELKATEERAGLRTKLAAVVEALDIAQKVMAMFKEELLDRKVNCEDATNETMWQTLSTHFMEQCDYARTTIKVALSKAQEE